MATTADQAARVAALIAKRQAANPNYVPTAGEMRNAPITATPANPVTTIGNTVFKYDEADPTDYIYRVQAKKLAGKVLNEEEQYNYLRAVAKSNEQKAQANPYATDQYGADLLAQQEAARAKEKTSDEAALEAFRVQKDLENTAKIQQLNQQGVAQQNAAQRVLSFSGFGRSTSAAKQLSDIQGNTNQAIQMANAARDAEIAKYKAELEGADGDTLQSLDAQIAEYNKAAQTRQLESIKKTAEANQKNTVSFEDALKNLGETSNAAGIDIGDTKNLAYYGSMVRNADGTVNETKLRTLPENVQALIRLAAQTSAGGDYEFIEGTKTQQSGYFDKNTGKFIPLAQARSMGIGLSGLGGTPAAQVIASALNRDLDYVAKRIANSTARSSALIDPDVQTYLNRILDNMVLDKFLELKRGGATFGAMQQAERDMIRNSIGKIRSINSKEAALTILSDLREKGGRGRYDMKSLQTATPAADTTAVTYKQTATGPNGEKMGSNDGVNRVKI